MARKLLIISVCVVTLGLPIQCLAGSSECADSSYWSNLVHEEDSIVASILYLPYIALMAPYRMVDGIIFPKPTTQGTIPPAAHRVAH